MNLRAVLLALMMTIGPAAFANDLWFPQIAAGSGYKTKIVIAHVDTSATAQALGQLFFYNQDGSARTVTTLEAGTASSFNVTVPAQGTFTLTVTSPDVVLVGGAKYQGDSIVVGGVATYSVGATVVGVLPATSLTTGYVPILVRSGFETGIAVVNTAVAPIDVQFSLINPDGSAGQIGSKVHLATNGQTAKLVTELGFQGPFAAGTVMQVSVVGSGTFGALPLSIGNGYISSSTLIDPNDLQTPLYIPHVVLGSGYTMNFRIFNSSNTALGGTLRFKDTNGQPMNVAVTQTTAVATSPTSPDVFEVPSINAKGSVAVNVTVASGLKVGYATWESFVPNNPAVRVPAATGISATLFADPVHVGETGTTNFYSAAIPVDVGTGINTGVALATAGIAGSKIDVSLRNSIGALVATNSTVPQVNPLAAGNQLARYASEFFPSVSIASGYMIVQSTGPDGFLPLAILDSSGTFSTTATVRRSLYTPTQLVGNYTGSWNNTTFGSTGTASMQIAYNATTKVASITFDVNGNVFGGADPPAETWTCTVTQDGCKASFNSPVFGPGTFAIRFDGTMYIRSVPSIGYFNMDGYLTSTNLRAAYTVGLSGGKAVGTFSLSK